MRSTSALFWASAALHKSVAEHMQNTQAIAWAILASDRIDPHPLLPRMYPPPKENEAPLLALRLCTQDY
jgi:hypothetical protein